MGFFNETNYSNHYEDKNTENILTKMHPKFIPDGIDQNFILTEQERIFKLLREQRTQEILEKHRIKLSEAQEKSLKDKIQILNDILKRSNYADEELLEDVLELRKMYGYEKQKAFKEKVFGLLQERMVPEQLFNAINFESNYESSLNDVRIVEGLQRKHEKQKEMELKKKRAAFCESVREAYKRMVSRRNKNQERVERIYRTISSITHGFEKEEQKRIEKESRERIKNMKSVDEQGYQKLLMENKENRLKFILGKTDEYIEEISRKIRILQNNNIENKINIADEENICSEFLGNIERVTQQLKSLTLPLKDYQLKGVEWLVNLYNNRLNGILADEMGLGKTVQTIGFISYLQETKNKNGPFLIVVPLSTISNWSNEFKRWNPSIKFIEYKGSPETRKSLQQPIKEGKIDVIITTYDYILKDKNFLSKIEWFYLIVDEGHRLKNKESKLGAIFNTKYNSRFRFILTGTPLQNSLPELWSILNFVVPQIFNSLSNFEDWFNAPLSFANEKMEITEEEKLIIAKKLHTILRPFILRRLKKDVANELPEKVERVLKVEMSKVQRIVYDLIKQKSQIKFMEAENKLTNQEISKNGEYNSNEYNNSNVHNVSDINGEYKKILENGIKNSAMNSVVNANNCCMQLRKICNHPFIFEQIEKKINPFGLNNHLLFTLSGKFEILNRILPKLKKTNHRVLIFFQMTQIMTIMEDFLNMQGFKYLRLDGNKRSDERAQLIDRFNNESEIFIFLLSTRAGGLGLNLTSADTVVIFDSDWNPHADLQAQDRVHRIGQKKEVRIFRLVTTDSIEEYMLQRAILKLDLDTKVIQAGKFDQLHYDKSDKEEENIENSNHQTENLSDDKEQEIADINQLLARSEEELAIFQKMDEQFQYPPLDITNDFKIGDLDEEVFEVKKYTGNEQRNKKMKFDTKENKNEDLYNLLTKAREGSRKRISIFMTLPSKESYPDYYQTIENPISMNCIRNKMKKPDYELEEMCDDLRLMFDNAMQYNIEGSQVHEDALYYKNMIDEYCESHL